MYESSCLILSHLNQPIHFSLSGSSIKHADRCFWHLKSTFLYIHRGMIINSDKQSEMTYNYTPFQFWRQSSRISHLEIQADKPALSGVLTWNQRYISDMNNSRFSHTSGVVTCHYLSPRSLNIGREPSWWQHLSLFTPNLSSSRI